MRKSIPGLAALLGLQLALAVGLSMAGPNETASRPAAPLLDTSQEQIDRITIADGESTSVTLHRDGGRWVVDERDGFPADQAKVSALLDTLSGLKTGTPIATSEAARQRFKVSETHFERRLALGSSGDTLATLWFGTTPSMGQLHVRRQGEAAIHSVALERHALATQPRDWIDHGVLQRPADQVVSLATKALTLTRMTSNGSPAHGQDDSGTGTDTTGQGTAPKSASGVKWKATPLSEQQTLDQDKANELVRQISGLRVRDLVMEKVNLEKPLLTLDMTVKGEDGTKEKTLTYRIGQRPGQDVYMLQVSSRPKDTFTVASSLGDSLLELASQKRLLKQPAQASATTDGRDSTTQDS